MTLRCWCGAVARAQAPAKGGAGELGIEQPSLVLMLGEFLVEHAHCSTKGEPVDGAIAMRVEANAFPSPMSYKGRKRSRRVG